MTIMFASSGVPLSPPCTPDGSGQGNGKMDHLKFDCYDLATQNTELYNYYRFIRQLSDDLTHTINTLDPQIASYPDLQKRFSASQTVMSDIVAQLLSAHRSIEQVIDVYYSAEHRVLESVEDLPDHIAAAGHAAVSGHIPVAPPSSINSGDLILENWLLERIIEESKDDSRGHTTST